MGPAFVAGAEFEEKDVFTLQWSRWCNVASGFEVPVEQQPMGAREWYYVGKFGQVGPLPEDHAMDLAACGVISSDTFVWCQGMPDWKRAGEVGEFRLKLPAATPPPFAQAPPAYPQMYPRDFAHLIPSKPKSPHSRVAGGVLNIVLPGVGRMYLGFTGIGVLQLVATICSGGILYFWPLIDGILMLAGSLREDALGRQLES